MTTKETWRDTPAFDYEVRRERAEAHCRTQQHGRHIDTIPLEPRQPPLIHPPAFPKLKICGGERCKAKVMMGSDGLPFIHSFAHGGGVYLLRYDAHAIRVRIERATDKIDAFTRLMIAADVD